MTPASSKVGFFFQCIGTFVCAFVLGGVVTASAIALIRYLCGLH